MLIYLALHLLGLLERRFNLKPLMMNYAIVCFLCLQRSFRRSEWITEKPRKEIQAFSEPTTKTNLNKWNCQKNH